MRTPRTVAGRTIAIAALAAVTGILSVTAVAFGYVGYNYGTRYTNQTLYVGGGYHGIVRVSTRTEFTNHSVCAKGEMQDGSHKGGGGCNTNTNKRESSFVNYSPYSAGYGYFVYYAGVPDDIEVWECGSNWVAECDI